MADKTQDPEEYVTIAEFIEPVFAQMARGALESAGIECFLEGEHANGLIGAAFWAQLQVHRQDEEAFRFCVGLPAAIWREASLLS